MRKKYFLLTLCPVVHCSTTLIDNICARLHFRHLLYNGKNNMQAWGLIVLLVSKAGGHAAHIPDMEQDKSAGVLHSQRALAEVTEMIRISHLVHQGLVNLQPLTQAGHDLSMHSDMTFGNKIALLSGDYLLGNSCAELAGLRFVFDAFPEDRFRLICLSTEIRNLLN